MRLSTVEQPARKEARSATTSANQSLLYRWCKEGRVVHDQRDAGRLAIGAPHRETPECVLFIPMLRNGGEVGVEHEAFSPTVDKIFFG